jgi:hypothetical protein
LKAQTDYPSDLRQQPSLSMEEIARTFSAEIVERSPGDELRFWRAWNALQPEASDIRVEPRFVGKPYQRRSLTSRAAAMQVRKGMEAKVLAAIRELGRATDDDVAAHLETDSNSVRPRRIALARRGVITEAGKRVTRAGRFAIAWRAVV